MKTVTSRLSIPKLLVPVSATRARIDLEVLYTMAMWVESGGRYNLPPIWNNIIKERLTESAMGTTSGGGAQSEESVSVPSRL